MYLDERLRRRLQTKMAAASMLEDGETIGEEALLGHIGVEVHGTGLAALGSLAIHEATEEGRALLLTDRRVLYLDTVLHRRLKVKKLLCHWPINAAPISIVQLHQRGSGATILEIGGVQQMERAGGPDGTITEIGKVGVERMHVAQSTLEEISLISEFVEIAAGTGPS